MNIATLKAAIDGVTADGDSSRLSKRHEVLKNLTKRELISLLAEVYEIKYPHAGSRFSVFGARKRALKNKKDDLIRWLCEDLDSVA